jgi:hypothetical protein
LLSCALIISHSEVLEKALMCHYQVLMNGMPADAFRNAEHADPNFTEAKKDVSDVLLWLARGYWSQLLKLRCTFAKRMPKKPLSGMI